MRRKCNHNRPEFVGKKITGWYSARRRCGVCGRFCRDGCLLKKEWRSRCEPSPAACERKPECRDEAPVESECEPVCTEFEGEPKTGCRACPWVYEQERFLHLREESFMEEAAFECAPNFAGLLSDELPRAPH